MSGLTIENLIKIIIGALVVVAVIVGIYFLFKTKIYDFFKGFSVKSSPAFILRLLK